MVFESPVLSLVDQVDAADATVEAFYARGGLADPHTGSAGQGAAPVGAVVTDGACTVPEMGSEGWDARVATVDDADEIAHLLHDFNVEYDTPTPGPAVIAARLRELLAGESTFALVAGTPAVGVGLVTLRPNVWYEGPVALLDELYVVPDLRSKGIGTGMIELLVSTCHDRGVDVIEINVDEGDVDTQRFYERHGFSVVDPDTHERAFYFYRELTPG